MPQTATAMDTRQQGEATLAQVVTANLPDGTAVEIIIPPPLCVRLATAIQSFLLRSMAIAQQMGGVALLPVTNVGHSHRKNDHTLVLQTENLGAIGFQLTPLQWQRVREIALEVQPDARGIH